MCFHTDMYNWRSKAVVYRKQMQHVTPSCFWQHHMSVKVFNDMIINDLKAIIVQMIAIFKLHFTLFSKSHCIWALIMATVRSITDYNHHVSWGPCHLCFAFALHAIFFIKMFQGSHPPCFWCAFLISHFKQKVTLFLKTHLTAAKDAPAVFNSLRASPSLSLSVHRIQIISRASLCCCMEGIGVFDLDLLDNIGSALISFHARPSLLLHWDVGVVLFLGKLSK